MGYADLKNDVVFRKVFGQHPDVLMGLLNDLLDRHGPEAITSLEYLPPDQAPLVMGLKLSILDVRCRDASGTVFLVEMQVLYVTGFLNRVVYNACKAYVGTLLKGHVYSTLTDVIAVSICDFELWSDADQRAHGEPLVPLVSQWSMRERTSASGRGMGQVQFVFCELPKLGDRTPSNNVERWAALFRSAQVLDPAHMATVALTDAQRSALDYARDETFTAAEQDAILRSFEEVDQVVRIVQHASSKARIEGRNEGLAQGLAALVRQFERRLARPLHDAERATLSARLSSLGAEQVGDVVLDLTPDDLARWLTDPTAR